MARTQFCPQFILVLPTLTRLYALRRAKDPNPRATKGIPNFLGIFRAGGKKARVLGEYIHDTRRNGIAQEQ